MQKPSRRQSHPFLDQGVNFDPQYLQITPLDFSDSLKLVRYYNDQQGTHRSQELRSFSYVKNLFIEFKTFVYRLLTPSSVLIRLKLRAMNKYLIFKELPPYSGPWWGFLKNLYIILGICLKQSII